MKENTTSPYLSRSANSGNEPQQGGSVQFNGFDQTSVGLRLPSLSVGLFFKSIFQHLFFNQLGAI